MNRILRAIITLLVIGCAAAFTFSASLYTEALVDAVFALALASVVILHLRVRPEWSDVFLVLAGTVSLATIDFRVLHYSAKIMAWFSFAGVSSFLIMAIRALWTDDRTRRNMLIYAWVPAALFVASDYFASTMLQWTAAAHPRTLDLYLLSFDYSLRVELVFIAGRMFALYSWLHITSLLVYVGLAIPISLVYAGRLIRFKEKSFPSMLAFLITGPVGILFYNLFPACGPRALFQQGFPFRPFPMDQAPRLLLEPMAIVGARNAIPSLHMAWVLLAWWYSRGLSWLERLIAFCFLAFTVFATLGTGEHWFVDLIVAFPFALMIQAACAYPISWRDSKRLAAFFFGLVVTLAWLITLRYGASLFWTSPVVPWALAAATVVLTSLRQAKLDHAADATNGADHRLGDAVVSPRSEMPVAANQT
ncbi:MAG TPA: phosphatase PAP2 family protein [Candidatus Acidoferrales bacterium]|nr:phosphatase PAP2 family protein [Candidatus Acidoferrales bacterium]